MLCLSLIYSKEKLKIYQHGDSYTLSKTIVIKKYYNSGIKEETGSQERYIFYSDVGKGKKERVEILKWKGNDMWVCDYYVNEIPFEYEEDSSWKLQGRACYHEVK